MKSRWAAVIATLAVLAVGTALPAGAQPESLSITNPSSDVFFDEAGDYATLVWNDPWDMSQPVDVMQVDGGHTVYANYFNDYTPCAAGLWCGQVRPDASNPDLFLLHPGYPAALHVGRDGNLRSIDANTYQRLTFRMYLDSVPSGSVGWQAMWTNGTAADFCDPQKCGQTVFFPLYQGWNIYSVDLTATRMNGMPWGGNLTGLRLDIGNANMQNRVVFLDWARLSGPNGDNRTIQWNASGESGNATIQFQSSDGATTPYRTYTLNGNVAYPATMLANAGSYTFRGSLPPDSWRVNLQTSNSSSTSAGQWRIAPAPTLTFVKPSYTSGDDFATVVRGNPWDMNDEGDINGGVVNAHGHVFANGILSAWSNQTANTTCVPGNCNPDWADPQVFLNGSSPRIDTNRFRYMTFALKVDGTPDVGYGYVARVVWPFDSACGFSNDIPLHADWNVVSIDLWGNIVDEQAGSCGAAWRAVPSRTQFRLDPHEVPISTKFYVDYAMLTAMDTASASGNFPIEYSLGKPGASVTFYYNTTRSINGRVPANPSGQGAPSAGRFSLFLPLVSRQIAAAGGQPGQQTFLWHLAGVSPNTYYISADVYDGSTTTTWISDTPVVVTP